MATSSKHGYGKSYRVPCNVTFDADKRKFAKVPAIAKWNSVTLEDADKLENSGARYKHFLFLTGKKLRFL